MIQSDQRLITISVRGNFDKDVGCSVHLTKRGGANVVHLTTRNNDGQGPILDLSVEEAHELAASLRSIVGGD